MRTSTWCDVSPSGRPTFYMLLHPCIDISDLVPFGALVPLCSVQCSCLVSSVSPLPPRSVERFPTISIDPNVVRVSPRHCNQF